MIYFLPFTKCTRQQTIKLFKNLRTFTSKPTASEVLTCHLRQREYPPWTSYFVKQSKVKNDQFGMSYFNWEVDGYNYHILRTGCFPYMKYHCTKHSYQNLNSLDFFFRCLKLFNLGIPCLAYGIGALFLIRHHENVHTSQGVVRVYFLYEEEKGARY